MVNRDVEKGGLSWKEAMSLTAESGGIGSRNVLFMGRLKPGFHYPSSLSELMDREVWCIF